METPLSVALGLIAFALAVILLNALIHRFKVRITFRNNQRNGGWK